MTAEKIPIEKNSVQETLLVPLYGRKMCAEKFPELYHDDSAKKLCERIDYDFSEIDKKNQAFMYEFGALEAAMRQLDIMWEIDDYLKKYPCATIVNLGCGLDQTGRVCDNGTCKIVNVDFPNIIEVREQLLPVGEREKNIPRDLTDHSWMDEVDASEGVLLFAAGVFHYFKRDAVRDLVVTMAQKFPGGRLIFDTVGKLGLKMMISQSLSAMGISEVSGLFYVRDAERELRWSDKIQVTSRDYMLGYHDMKSPGIRGSHRFLARVGDR
ncbi:MAG: class I SAM-dependent methyltransferase, partial [Peptostreptococcaceae bacterium]|nr:class I SAM-dependent methyltransferase [Peptostreptococcaceae bacterium]